MGHRKTSIIRRFSLLNTWGWGVNGVKWASLFISTETNDQSKSQTVQTVLYYTIKKSMPHITVTHKCSITTPDNWQKKTNQLQSNPILFSPRSLHFQFIWYIGGKNPTFISSDPYTMSKCSHHSVVGKQMFDLILVNLP